MSAAAPKSPKKKSSKPKAAPSHPPYASMITKAITTLKEPKGSSKSAILKYILANYKVGTNPTAVNSHLRVALRHGLKSGLIRHAKGGVGAAGSFKLGEKEKKAKKPKAKKPKSPKKKSTKAKKSSPKKASKPKKAATPKKAKSPKKASKPKKKTSPKKKAAKK